jgi:hypothetical protein
MENDYIQETKIENKDYQDSQEKLELERSILEKARENQTLRENSENNSEVNSDNEKSLEKKNQENLESKNNEFKDYEPLIDYDDKSMKGDVGENIAKKALESEYGIDFNQMPNRLEGWDGRLCDKIAQDENGDLIIAEVKYWNDFDSAAKNAYEQLENTYNKLQGDVKEIVYVYIDPAENANLYKFSPDEFKKFENAQNFVDYIKNHLPIKTYRF